jgi:septin family protein
MNVRFGLMIIGPTLSGKTACFEALKDAMNDISAEELN